MSFCLVGDQLRFVVQSFDGIVVDRHPEVIEDAVFVATQHPGEVAHRGEPRMGRPPKPLLQTPLRPAGTAVIPAVAEERFEEVTFGGS